MKNTDTFQALLHVSYAQLRTECVLLDTKRGTYFELNEVATEIWLLLAKDAVSILDIHISLLSIFDVPSANLLEDIHEIITQLLHDKLIEKVS
ncbi:MAG: PqqD family protein [Spirosomataceae bacterium]